MGFDTSALTAWVSNNSKKIALGAVGNAQTAKVLMDSANVQFDVKGSASILKMSQTITFQDGASCGRSDLGDTVLSDATITVKPIKINTSICPKALYSTFYANMVAKGNDPESGVDAEFAETMMTNKQSQFSFEIEKLIWQGDTSLTGSTNNLRFINGIVKQVAGGSPVALTVTGSTIVNKIQNAFLSMTVAERGSQDFKVFIGEDKHQEYLVALSNANIFKSADDKSVFGTTAQFEVVAGLNGTGKIYMTRLSNLQLGLDGADDVAKFQYSNETEKYYLDIYSSVGISVIDVTKVGTGSI